MRSQRILAAIAAAAAVWMGPAVAGATPVTHTLLPSSSLSGTVQGTLGVQLFTNLGTQNGTATATGTLSSTPNGTIQIDWGSPSWSGNLAVPSGGAAINVPSPGTATGNATINLFSLLNVNFALSIPISNITLGIGAASTAPISPNNPADPGPWTSSIPALDLTIGATGSFNATGPFGINVSGPLNIAPASVGGIPVTGTLTRTGGYPGTGTQIEIPVNGLNLSIPPGSPTNIPTPGCEVSVLFGCNLNVTSVNVTLTSLQFLNVNGVIRAAQTGIAVIPEPTTMALVGLGLAGLAAAGRRR